MNLTEFVDSEKYERNLEFVKNPLNFSNIDMESHTEPPLIGENTEEVLEGILGMTKKEV